jgi:hypothetical protein
MTALELYLFRLELLNRGYIPVPCFPDGRPALSACGVPTEGAIRGWPSYWPEATATGILDPITRQVVIVTEIPKSAEELHAQEMAAAEALQAQRVDDQKAAKRLKDRCWIARKRRAGGMAEWLAQHAISPWEKAGVSKWIYYENRRKSLSKGI